MKILVVFLDMVRVDHISHYNDKCKRTPIDNLFENIGGIVFKNCYTPGPDTPRSNACLQTGLLPFFNGCDTRIKWPKFFIKDDTTTIYDHLIDKGYKVNLCAEQVSINTGLFKYQNGSDVNISNDHFAFVEETKKLGGNVFSFICSEDMHHAITDYSATEKAFEEGFKMLNILFDKVVTREYIDNFDYTIIYSDHGCSTCCDGLQTDLNLLDNSRTQLLLFLHKKGDCGVLVDNSLRILTDVYATIANIIGLSDYRQGIPLFDEVPEERIIHIEDHKDFSVSPEVMVKQWRIVSKDFDIYTDISNTLIKRGEEKDIQKSISYLEKYSPSYSIYKKQLDVWKLYAKLNEHENNKYYFVGKRRCNRVSLIIYKIYSKLQKYIL